MAKSKKPRNKKYNPQKGAQARAVRVLKGVKVAFRTGGSGHVCLAKPAQKKLLSCTAMEADCVEKYPHPWSVLICCMGIDANGKQYMKSDLIKASAPYYQRDLEPTLTAEHKRLRSEFNEKHLVNAGWIACPLGSDICEKEAAEFFDHWGAWEITVNIADTALPKRIIKALIAGGVTTVKQLETLTEDALLSIRDIGPASVRAIVTSFAGEAVA